MTVTAPPPARHVIAVDIGGTHTDAALLSATGELHVNKVRSTPGDPGIALITAIEGLLAASGLDFGDIAAVAHGTTVATNAVILGDYARVGMLVTSGFEDVLEIATQQRPDLYDPWRGKPEPLVPRERVRGVDERIGADGTVVRPLDEGQVRAAVRDLVAHGAVEAIAVVLLFSFANPAHERRVKDIVRDELPGVPVTISSAVAPEFREYPRAVTTALNAALLPGSGGYIARLEDRLHERGFTGAFQLMTSTGGVVPASVAKDVPVSLLVSGPAAGAVAAAELGARLGERDLVMLDVGGTSADVALIEDGRPQRRYRGEVGGMPVALPQVDVLPIGAGGGSLARVDAFGALRVGPESAGADPGPAAYGIGVTPALTDAHIVLGSIDPGGLLGGRLPLDSARARAAIVDDVADRLGISAEAAAGHMVRIADGRMADALRLVTVGRGFDVRRCALMAFGGAGPLHACAIADDLGIDRVVVPRFPGLTSALGLLMGDGGYEVRRTTVGALRDLDHERITAVIDELVQEGADMLAEAGAAPRMSLDLDLRYAGQAYELTVPVSEDCTFGPADIERVEADFRSAHEAAYGHSWPDSPIELVTVRVRARVPRLAVDWIGGAAEDRSGEPSVAGPTADASVHAARAGWTTAAEPVQYAVVDRADVVPGLAGPALIQQTDTTTLLPAGWRVDRVENVGMVLTRTAEEGSGR